MYDVGDTVTLQVVTTHADGTAVDLTDIQVAITKPDGSVLTLSGADVAHPGTGQYAAQFVADQEGLHRYRWTGTGPSFAQPGTFTVWPELTVVSLDDVKASLQIKRTDNDEELRGFIESAIAAIENRVGPLTPRTVQSEISFRSWVRPGNAVGVLPLQPVLSLTSVTRIGAQSPLDTTNVVTSPEGLVYDSYGSLGVCGRCTVVYVVGRQTVPADLYRAVIEMTRHLWQTQRGGASRSQDTEPIAGSAWAFPYRVEQLLAPHTPIGIG